MNRVCVLLACSCLLALAACSDDDGPSASVTTPDGAGTVTSTSPATSSLPTTAPGSAPVATSPADTVRPTSALPTSSNAPAVPGAPCDPAVARSCLLPWPNDAYTSPDEGTPTGLRLAIPSEWTPANVDGTHVDVTDQNRADGFSPGSAIIIDAPGVDVDKSGIAPSTDIGASLAAGSPIVITDTTTGEPWPYWGELDAQADDGTGRLLMIHPALSLTEAHTYRVDVTGLVGADGAAIDLDVASWSFTVASAESLSGRLLQMRDDAYASLGDGAPAFTVTRSVDDGTVRSVEGTIDVPLYLSGDGAPGSGFELDGDDLPTRNAATPVYPARFRCLLPLDPAAPVPTVVYGHGLFSNRSEVDAFRFAAELGLVGTCATDWLGMSSDDVGALAGTLSDLSTFNTLADRMQQGMLNFQFLGRAINDERAFASHSAFNTAEGSPIIAAGETQFVGNSQGGILGGAATAISTEWERAVLGVPGINFSLILPRSNVWPQLEVFFDAAYSKSVDRTLALQLIQLLWDRAENDGYAQHVTSDPYPGTPAKDVLIIEAFGDHMVPNVSTEVLARTMDVPVHEPSLAPGRSDDVDPQWGIDPLTGGSGSALFVWDFGTPPPPADNLPPAGPEYGEDPHGASADEQRVLTLALGFVLSGTIPDVCGDAPCVSDVLTG